MNYETIHTIITAGTTYMVAATGISFFGLYKLAKTGLFRDFFTSK